MAEGGVSQEGRSWRKPSTWFSRPKAVSPEAIAAPAAPVVVPQEYLESLIGDVDAVSEEQQKYFPDMVQKIYTPLIAEIDTLTDEETRQALTAAVNKGHKDVIAVLSFRIWNKVDPHRRRLANNKVPYIATFAGIMQREVVAEVIDKDDTDRIDSVKRSWAEGAFFKAVESSNWKGGIQSEGLPGAGFAVGEGVAIANAVDQGIRNPGKV